MKNRTLLFVVLAMLPMVVISFSYRIDETNFNLDLSSNRRGLVNLRTEAAFEECQGITEINLNSDISIRVLRGSNVEEIPLEEYVLGVVAGEMPASFDIEALKAQAVAARTYALYRKNTSTGRYDVTDDTRTQVYISKDDMQKKWGKDFDKYYNKILLAIEGTRGQVATYDGKIIEAFYFAMSGGSTQDAAYVFNVNRDYLKGVESSYENNSIKGFQVTRTYTHDTIKSKLGLTCPKVSLDYINYNDEGYVDEVSFCGKKISGINLSYKIGLRSSNFKVSIGDNVVITTLGFGHGVGMSQYGANGYANAGYTYDQIIKHYYTGVEIVDVKNV